MEHSVQEYMVQSSEQGMVEVSAYLTHAGVFGSSGWIRFRTSNEELETNRALGLVIPVECPACGEMIQMPAMGVNDQGLLEFSQEGIEELERRGIEFS